MLIFLFLFASLRAVELAQTFSKTEQLHLSRKEWLDYSQLELGAEWLSWRRAHGKGYSTRVHELERYVVWRSNKEYIKQHNKHAHKFGYTLAMNGFGDMTFREYVESVQCIETYTSTLNASATAAQKSSWFSSSSPPPPEKVDWRTLNIVTDVKDQGRCRSCYAFAVTGALEGAQALASGKLVSLSEQNIIDCSVPYGNRGCGGGSRFASLMYILDNGGINSDNTYPYIARQSLCRYNAQSSAATVIGMVHIGEDDENELKKAVAELGPVTVAIDSSHTSFQFYSDGIYSEPGCSSSALSHTMLVVGYDTSSSGKDYWIVKNSWGTTWGDGGYIKMARNYGNQCGIASSAVFPTISYATRSNGEIERR